MLLKPLICSRTKFDNINILVVSGPLIMKKRKHHIKTNSIIRSISPPPKYKEKETDKFIEDDYIKEKE